MPFLHDTEFEEAIRGFYGKYHSTFRSENEQVIAQMFEVDGWLVAHISFAPGVTGATATDRYFSELTRYADEQGFAGKLSTIFS